MKKPKIPLFVIILAVILIIGGLIFVLKYSDKKSLLGKKTDKDSKENLKDLKDSDNDGLKDWEENLYKTDPYNPDTDSDGISDYEEIRFGRNPLVKAPGDEATFYPLPLGEKYNATKKILDEKTLGPLLSSYLSNLSNLNDSDINDPSKIKEITEQSVNENYEYLIGQNQTQLSELSQIFEIFISDEEIKISQDNSKQAIELYVSKISEWLNSDVFFLQNEALQIVSNALQTQDFNHLDRLIKLNDSWINKLKDIAVPSSWKEVHKEGLGIIILTRNIFVSLRDYQNDPVKALYAAEKLQEIASVWTDLIKKAINLAKTQGVQLPL